jgi:hypothetical protein
MMKERELQKLASGDVPDDLQRIVGLALDLAFYRTSPIGGDLATAVVVELRDAVEQLPEARAMR